MSRAKNPKYESMSLEELKANMEKSKKELEQAIHNKNILEQRKKLAERRERSHRLIVKGAEFEKAFPLSKDLEQGGALQDGTDNAVNIIALVHQRSKGQSFIFFGQLIKFFLNMIGNIRSCIIGLLREGQQDTVLSVDVGVDRIGVVCDEAVCHIR